MKYTHKGWFGVCPVYLAKLETSCPHVMVRHPLLEPLFQLIVWITQTFDPSDNFKFTVTGELEEPYDDEAQG